MRTLAAAPYAITDLTPIAASALSRYDEATVGFGFPSAVDNTGGIPYLVVCECAGGVGGNDITIEIDDTGTFSRTLYEDDNLRRGGQAIPYGVGSSGNIAGEVTYYGSQNGYQQVIAWLKSGSGYQSGAVDYTYALGINDAGVSVGSDTGAKGSFAAMFSVNARGAVGRKLLLPPKNTSWTGVATGINDAGEMVGYATFPNNGNGRAVRFFPTGDAQVIPVSAAGVSTAAQAINVRGDIVGSAGSQAFLYRSNHSTLLPRPPGDEAGNAVAYAINAHDQVVGDIASSTNLTAFLYEGGRSYDLNALLPANSGWHIQHAAGINDAGQIVGEGYFLGDGDALAGFSMKPVSDASLKPRESRK